MAACFWDHTLFPKHFWSWLPRILFTPLTSTSQIYDVYSEPCLPEWLQISITHYPLPPATLSFGMNFKNKKWRDKMIKKSLPLLTGNFLLLISHFYDKCYICISVSLKHGFTDMKIFCTIKAIFPWINKTYYSNIFLTKLISVTYGITMTCILR